MMKRTDKSKETVLARAYRATFPAISTTVFFSFFINILAFVGPIYMMQIYDRVISSRNETTLAMLTLIAVFLIVVYASLERVRSAVLVRAGVVFDSTAREDLFGKVLKGTLRNPAGGHQQSLRDLDTIREFLTGGGLIAFCDAPWVPIFVVACFILHPWFGWIALLSAITIFAFALMNELMTREQLKKASGSSIAANNYAAATMRNAEVLHAMGMLAPLRQRWVSKHAEVLDWQAQASDRAGLLVAATKFLRTVLQIVILGTGAYLAIKQEISAGSMIAASILMGRALAPVEAAVANWKNFAGTRSAHGRIKLLLEQLQDEAERMPLPAPRGQLTVENVISAPPGSKQAVLRGVSFGVEPGEILGVIGPSAAGKSSLARVLVGVWPTLSGSVRIDGADLTHWDPERLGQYVGYLPQDVELFAGSIAENISRFDASNEEAIITAAQMASVHNMVQNFADGYNTQIGEGGHALSGGQRQRIGLARALYGLPALIVLDEPNASLDADGEVALLQSLQLLRQAKRTVVVITHKTNMLNAVDKILVLNQGQVQGFGSRDEVLSRLLAPKGVPAARPQAMAG
jgi:ATP-binding cassette subfamily C protein